MLLSTRRSPARPTEGADCAGATSTRQLSIIFSLLLWLSLATVASAATSAGQPDNGSEQTPAKPGREDPGHGSITTQLGLYNHLDKDGKEGNPFVEEKLTVIEPAVLIDYSATERLGVSTTLNYGHITSASIDNIPGRDRRWYGSDYALGADVGVRYWSTDQLQVGGHIGLSRESDFRSLSAGGRVSFTREDQNATVSLSVDGFRDSLDVTRFDGDQEGWARRTTFTGTLDWFQVLSPQVVSEFGITVSRQTGLLETPFAFVVLEDAALPPNPNLANHARGQQVQERLPDRRARGTLYGRVRRWIREGTAVELGGRLYDDSWGIRSVSVEPRLYQTLWSPSLRMRLRYRYYVQTAARYYEDHFYEVSGYRTQDSDLADLHSHTVGGKITWDPSDRNSFSLGGDYVMRSDKINQTFFAVSWVRKF